MFFKSKRKEPSIKLKNKLNPEWIPILTLDEKWHYLFTMFQKTSEVKKLELKVNCLLKEQGSIQTQLHQLYNTKKLLLSKIMELTTEAFEYENENAKIEMDKAQQKIVQINQQFEEKQKRAEIVPLELREVNFQLFEQTLKLVYPDLHRSQQNHDEIAEKIEKLRIELKQSIERKVLLEEKIKHTYEYLHDILGAESTEMLDEWMMR